MRALSISSAPPVLSKLAFAAETMFATVMSPTAEERSPSEPAVDRFVTVSAPPLSKSKAPMIASVTLRSPLVDVSETAPSASRSVAVRPFPADPATPPAPPISRRLSVAAPVTSKARSPSIWTS